MTFLNPISPKLYSLREIRSLRIGKKGTTGRIPTEGADTELNDGELLSGVLNLEVPHIGAVELKAFTPRGARHSGHLKVDRHEVSLPNPRSQVL